MLYYSINEKTKKVNYYINEEKRTVVCVISFIDDIFEDTIKFVGKAKCDPEDNFDIKVGKKIASNRAWLKFETLKLKDIQREKEAIENRLEGVKRQEFKEMDIIDKLLDNIEKFSNIEE